MSFEKANEYLQTMSLEEKIGQVVMCGFNGKEISLDVRKLIEKYHVGSIILFGRNVESPSQLRTLTRKLQEISKIPLLISIDQEGGIVTRLKGEFTVFPSNMAIAATGNTANAYLAGLIMATEMRAVGINWNLAPVVDVNDLPENPGIGVRSYSDDPEVVAEYATEFVRGLHEGKVAACAKHFPGKGHSAKDAHLEMPVVERSREELENIDFYPFKSTINMGIDAVMPSHVHYPALCKEEKLPATLCENVMENLLREEMNFEGICVTDDLEMKGITNSLTGSEAAWRALRAGADMVMICHTFEEQVKTFEKLKEKVKDGEVPIERLDEAVLRVLKLKEKLGLLDGVLEIENSIGSEESRRIAENVAQRALTICRNVNGIIDYISTGPILIVFPLNRKLTMVEEEKEKSVEMEIVFKRYVNFPVRTIFYSQNPNEDEIKSVLTEIREFDGTIMLNTINAYLNEKLKGFIKEVMNIKSEKTVLVALRNPYDCFLPGVENSVALYCDSDVSQRVFAKSIAYNKKLNGKLPLFHLE